MQIYTLENPSLHSQRDSIYSKALALFVCLSCKRLFFYMSKLFLMNQSYKRPHRRRQRKTVEKNCVWLLKTHKYSDEIYGFKWRGSFRFMNFLHGNFRPEQVHRLVSICRWWYDTKAILVIIFYIRSNKTSSYAVLTLFIIAIRVRERQRAKNLKFNYKFETQRSRTLCGFSIGKPKLKWENRFEIEYWNLIFR